MRSPSVCSRFAAVAARFGGAPALVCDGVRISYADLDASLYAHQRSIAACGTAHEARLSVSSRVVQLKRQPRSWAY